MQFGEFIIGRQPILNAKEETVAYELLFRSADMNAAHVTDHMGATSRVLVNLMNNFGLDQLLGGNTAFVNVNDSFVLDGMLEVLPPEHFIIEILETSKVGPTLIGKITEYKRKGYRFAMDDIVLTEEFLKTFAPIFPLMDVFKLEIMGCERDSVKKLATMLKRFPGKLLAEKVETHEDFAFCKDVGFDYYQGYFFAKPKVLKTTSIEPSKLSLMQILSQLRSEASLDELEQSFKLQPELSVNLLKFINSSAFFMRTEIKSIKHALSLIGRSQIFKWITMMLYAGASVAGEKSPLLESALVRAKTMENLLTSINKKDDKSMDEAHFTGLLSLLDTVFNVPMDMLVDSLRVSASVREALLERKGMLGQMLLLVEISDGVCDGDLNSLLAETKITADGLSEAKMNAIIWVAEQNRKA